MFYNSDRQNKQDYSEVVSEQLFVAEGINAGAGLNWIYFALFARQNCDLNC